ncbi:hypothetical protein [Engelhardtia mirabilis]|uniref:hypothetical protein n=1 Tax=Engelhardtia mirabilis TaxID=2528011 RepID=UPI0011A70931
MHGPKDMHVGAGTPAVVAVDSSSNGARAASARVDVAQADAAAKQRIAALETELNAARALERSAVTRLERAEAGSRSEREVMLVEARSERERLQEELRLERERHDREVGKLRALVDQRERELRTLALEMGKVQGRLEVAERRLVDAREGPAARAGAGAISVASSGQRIERFVLLPILAAVTILIAVVGWRHFSAETPEVHASGSLGALAD